MTVHTAEVSRRSWSGRAVDGLAGRVLGLPPARTGYAVTRGLRVPMRDGVTLAADLYSPTSHAQGTLLVRGPYGRGMPSSLLLARIFAARGYAVLFVSSRGTFGSAGVFDPMRTEVADGQDVVRWMVDQDWFTGSFATLGASYLGYTQWALLVDPPAALAAAVVTVGPHDIARHTWGTGALNLDLLAWSDLVAYQEDGGLLRAARRQATAGRRLRPVLDALPVADAGERHFAGRAPWYRDRVTRPDPSDPFWAPMRNGAALDRVNVPVLLVGGWQDLFIGQTIEQYTRLHQRGIDVAMTVGPWTHVEVVGKGAGVLARESLDWLDHHLAGRAGSTRTSPVRVFVTGVDAWRDLLAWPPDTVQQEWHLQPGGGLTAQTPPADAPASTFTFDPADPTPTVGGPLLSGGGVVDDTALASRADVLALTSAPLPADMEVLGAPVVELAHSSDNPHVDVFARISEVDPRGRSHNVTEGYLRLDPARDGGPVTVRLLDTAHRFTAGNRLRLLLAGGSHPQYARNLGTDENPGTGTTLRPSTHVIGHGDGQVSRLTLPVATS
jgi:putative CocE/NonD family hydrolase